MLPRHLNPYIITGIGGQAINRNTGKTGTLGRTSSTSAAFSENQPAGPDPNAGYPGGPGGPTELPPIDGDGPGKVLVPDPAAQPNDPNSPLAGLQAAGGGGGPAQIASMQNALRPGLGQRTPPALEMLLRGKLY